MKKYTLNAVSFELVKEVKEVFQQQQQFDRSDLKATSDIAIVDKIQYRL